MKIEFHKTRPFYNQYLVQIDVDDTKKVIGHFLANPEQLQAEVEILPELTQ